MNSAQNKYWWAEEVENAWKKQSLQKRAPCLLLENINGVLILHFKLRRCIRFIDGLAIKSKPYLPHGQSLAITIGFHEFAERSVSLDFELYHRPILACNFQVYVLIVFCLDTVLGQNVLSQWHESDLFQTYKQIHLKSYLFLLKQFTLPMCWYHQNITFFFNKGAWPLLRHYKSETHIITIL